MIPVNIRSDDDIVLQLDIISPDYYYNKKYNDNNNYHHHIIIIAINARFVYILMKEYSLSA